MIAPEQFQIVKEDGSFAYEPGEFILSAGGCQPDEYSERLMNRKTLRTTVLMTEK